METCCFCGKQFDGTQMMDVTAGAAHGHRCCLDCGERLTCACGNTMYKGDASTLDGKEVCEICYVESLDQKKRYGWVREGCNATAVYLDPQGEEIYVHTVSGSPEESPYKGDGGTCLGELGRFLRNEEHMIGLGLRQFPKTGRNRTLLLVGDTSQTELQLLAEIVEKADMHHDIVILDHHDPSRMPITPLMMRRNCGGDVFPVGMDYGAMKLPKEFLGPPVAVIEALPDIDMPEPKMADPEPSIAPFKGRKRRFPRPK